MHEHIGDELPVIVSIEHVARYQCKRIGQPGKDELRQTKNHEVDSNEYVRNTPVDVSETFIDQCRFHGIKVIGVAISGKTAMILHEESKSAFSAHCEVFSQPFAALPAQRAAWWLMRVCIREVYERHGLSF